MLESLENRLRKTEERRYLMGNTKWTCWPFRYYETEAMSFSAEYDCEWAAGADFARDVLKMQERQWG